MQYKIDTIPIWNAFRENGKNGGAPCPICALRTKLENSLVSLYLNEAVMEPLYRIEVNKTGFCPAHFGRLLQGGNRCGLALQTVTRTEYLEKNLPRPGNRGAAAKAADHIREGLRGCVICDSLKKSFDTYMETVVKMWIGEPDFPAVFAKSSGFCLPHYAELLEFSRHAGKRAPNFLQAVRDVFFTNLERAKRNAENFTQKFDACKHGGAAPTVTAADAAALPNLIGKLTGN
ncbi:hypothetical protein FACS1894211_03180 [Clostridia bacterium]|nr:hypothetical protein FACS1894211_03180 [Clostridia bacterium]